MSRVKTFSVKLAALVVALVVAVVAFSAYGSSQNTNAAYSMRQYWRHDYNSTNPASYTQYALYVEQRPRSVYSPNRTESATEKSVVSLTITRNGDDEPGTGFIVDDHVIATSAYCVYDKYNNKFNNIMIDVVDSSNKTLASFTPRYAHISKDYVSEMGKHNAFDYALLYVEEDLSEYGIFGMGIATDHYVDISGQVKVCGFPYGYVPGATGTFGCRRTLTTNVVSTGTNAYCLNHNANTQIGENGGPVYVEEGFSVTSNGNTTNYKYQTVLAINITDDEQAAPGEEPISGIRINVSHLKFYFGNTYLTA